MSYEDNTPCCMCGEVVYFDAGIDYEGCPNYGEHAALCLECSRTHRLTVMKRHDPHIVKFEETTFTIQHPLAERESGYLWDCELHSEVSDLGPPSEGAGVYEVVLSGTVWRFKKIK